MHKNIISNNLKEFVLGLQEAVKEDYSVVEESVDFHAGYFKALTRKEDSSLAEFVDALVDADPTILNSTDALEMLENPGEPNEKLNEILELDKPVAQKPKRNRK